MVPENVYTLVPGTCDYLMTPGQMDVADVTKYMALKIGRLSWINWVVNPIG